VPTPHPDFVTRLARAAYDTPGATDRALRASVRDRANAPGCGSVALPVVAAYVDKVSRQAHRVTDDDVAALKAAGFSEDAIFEITVAAAVAAGLDRLDRGLRLLDGRER
jgi:alkylhydroperoxidase family enzyme